MGKRFSLQHLQRQNLFHDNDDSRLHRFVHSFHAENTYRWFVEILSGKKRLNIFGWCLMPSRLHLIANTKIPFDLDAVVRDFKRHTSKHTILLIENEAKRCRKSENWFCNECLPTEL